MKALENECTKCRGHMIIEELNMIAQCEDCGHEEPIKNKQDLHYLLEHSIELGPKEKRLVPTQLGKLLLYPNKGLGGYLKETLREATRGIDLEDYDLEQLNRFNLIENKKEAQSG